LKISARRPTIVDMADIIVVHGTPGAGKSTHSKNLAEHHLKDRPVFHISVGDRLRAIRTGEFQSKYGAEINDPNAPALLDHRLVNGVIFEYISLCSPDSVVLVDGYPRFADATEPFVEAVNEDDHKLLGCVHLEISQETSINRLAGRGVRRGERIGDITPGVAERRYDEHQTYTLEAIRELSEAAPVVKIDAELSEREVWTSFYNVVRDLASK